MLKIKSTTITSARLTAAKKLTKASASPNLDADVLLAHVLKKNREYIFTNSKNTLTAKQQDSYHKLTERRSAGEPIAYLVGHKEFFNLDLLVTPDVLIPRPGTEILVEETLKIIKKLRRVPHVVELGVGSGAISIALARNSRAHVRASDISTAALRVARRNATRLGANITFVRGDLLLPHTGQPIDILVANLPYLTTADSQKKRDPWGLRFEPASALYSGLDGLDHYRKLFSALAERPHKPRFILLEFDPRQVAKLIKCITHELPGANIEIINDYQPLPRVLKICL